jgi:hypothetical protein
VDSYSSGTLTPKLSRTSSLFDEVQVTKHKAQSSIRNTPEGTDTERVILIAVVRGTIKKEHAASGSSSAICTTPVGSEGGEVFGYGLIGKKKLFFGRNKPM